MSINEIEEILAAAHALELMALDNSNIEFPVDPELADFMGASYDPALDDENLEGGI